MIVDEPDAISPDAAAPNSGAVVVSRVDQILAPVTDAGHYGYLRPKAEDVLTDGQAGRDALNAVLDRWLDQCLALGDSAEAEVVRIEGAWRGHADRIADEAMDTLSSLLQKSRDNLNRQANAAHSLIESSGVQPVRNRDQTAWVLSVPASIAAEKFAATQPVGEWQGVIDSVASPPIDGNEGEFLAGGPLDSPSGPMPYQSVLDAIPGLVAQSQANGNAFVPTARIPVADDGSCSSTMAADPQFWYGPFNNSQVFQGPQNAWFDHTAQVRRAIAAGGSATYGQVRSGVASANQLLDVRVSFPDGSLIDYTFVVGSGRLPSDGPNGPAPTMPGGWPADVIPWDSGQFRAQFCEGQNVPAPPPEIPEPPPPVSDTPVSLPDSSAQCCPAPEPVTNNWSARSPIPAQPAFTTTGLDWCMVMNAVTSKPFFDTAPVAPGEPGKPPPPPSGPKYAGWLDVAKGIGSVFVPGDLLGLKDAVKGSPTEAMAVSLAVNQEMTAALSKAMEAANSLCSESVPRLATTVGLINWGESITGAPLKYLGLPYEYALKYCAPRQIPGQADIDMMYVNSQVSDNEWECYTRSQGNLPGVHRLVRDQKVTKPNLNEQIDLYMRDQYDFPELRDALKHYGVRNDEDIDKWLTLRDQIPQFQDIIRFMVRDTMNEKVVKDGQFDSGFSENFSGQLAVWARQQGITKDVALQFWRAHWELPSPTMAYQMLHRLRPGNVDPSIATTYDDVKTLLGTADYAPGWRDRMMAISYLTPTRTDIKQGYTRGVYDRKTILNMLQDTGLDVKGAESVAKLYDYEREVGQRTINEKNSAWSVKGATNEYVDGMLNRREYTFILESFGISAKRIESIVATADMKAVIKTRRSCSRAVERKYMLGIIDDKVAVKELADRDHELDAAEEMVKEWACRRSASVQEVPARKNVAWAIDGVITLDQLATRLRNLRYQPGDVDRFVQEAINRIREAAAKAAEKQLRDAVAELRRRKAEYEKLVKKLEKKKKELEKQNQPKGKA